MEDDVVDRGGTREATPATALQFETAVMAAGDPDDLRQLAPPLRRVRIFAL